MFDGRTQDKARVVDRFEFERAVRLIVNCQSADGGWRYNPQKEHPDSSVTICQIMALRAARNIGSRFASGARCAGSRGPTSC